MDHTDPIRIDIADIISPVLGVAEPTAPANQTAVAFEPGFCRHYQVSLDGKQRTVSCSDCGKALDAFDVLLGYARGERRWQTWDTLVREAQERVHQLKVEERKAKARLRNASRKDADAAVAAERVKTERMRIAIIESARDIKEACRRIERLAQRRAM